MANCSYNLQKYQSKNLVRKLAIWNYYQIVDSLIPKQLKKQKIKCLDAGCGEGFTLKFLQNKYPLWTLTGIDKRKSSLDFIKKSNLSIELTKGSILKMPFRDKSFDIIFCLEVLEHINNPDLALKEINRVGKNFIFTTPNEPIFRILRLMAGLNLKELGKCPGHKKLWSYKKFLEFISRYMEIKKSLCSFPYGWSYIFCSSA